MAAIVDAPPFTALYRETVADVFAYVATLVGDRSAAEDVVAQAYEKAYRRRSSYDPRRGSARAWLFGIARRCLANSCAAPTGPVLEAPDALTREDVLAMADGMTYTR